MPQNHEVFTPTAFIMGQITVMGMTGRSYAPDVRIIAQTNGHTTDTTAKNESSYVLLVAPGEWTVSAEVGGVISEPMKVSLESGQTVEINFSFGRRH